MRHATYQNKLVMRTTFVITKKHKNSAYKYDIRVRIYEKIIKSKLFDKHILILIS